MTPTQPTVINEFEIHVEQLHDYTFRVSFDKPSHAPLETDEPPPLGADSGPNPTRLLAAAVGNCLTASLLFCARKARADVGSLHSTVRTRVVRNERGRLRVDRMDVTIHADAPGAQADAGRRCLEIFQDYCTVTESVRHGIEVNVHVTGIADSAAKQV